MPAACCRFQCISRKPFATCSNSSVEISCLKYFSDANFNSRNLPTLGKPITELFILIPPFHFLVPAAKLSIMLLSVVLFADHHSSEGGFSMPRNPDIG